MTDILHLVRCNESAFTVVRALSPEEAADYRSALDHLREFDKSPAYLELVARNQLEFEAEVAIWASSAEELSKDPALQAHREIEFNRRVVNYLSAARLLLDHYESRLKRRYGASSAQVIEFKKEAAASYDKHFAYRFLYRLRNFAQHFGMPLTHVHVGGRLESPASSKVLYEASILLDVGALLEKGKDLWGRLAGELKTMEPLLDVRPYISTMTQELNRIVSHSQGLEKPKVTKTGRVVVEVMSAAIAKGHTPGVALIEEEPPKSRWQFVQPPFRLMQWLGFEGFEHPL